MTSKEIHIRAAVKEDVAALLTLVKKLAVYERAPDAVTVSAAHFAESGFGENPVWWAFVAEHENKIVAFALYYIRFSTWKGQCMYLEDIVVTEAYRGHGIGKMLMEKLIAEAQEKKLYGMQWQVLDWNEPAIRFYEKYPVEFQKEWWNVLMAL